MAAKEVGGERLQDDSPLLRSHYPQVALALLVAAAGIRSANAQDLLNQDWVLNSALSTVYMQTEKLQSVIEKHKFTSVEGSITKKVIAFRVIASAYPKRYGSRQINPS